MIIENGQISLCSDTMIDSSVVCSVTMITQGKKHLKNGPCHSLHITSKDKFFTLQRIKLKNNSQQL